MLRVIGVLLLIPLFDALLLVVVATRIGMVPTVAIVVLTGLVGLLLVRAEGRHTLRRIQQKLAQGDPPTDEVLDGALLIAAGAFLLTPGLVTDAVGFLLVLPPTRYPIRMLLKKYVVVPYADAKTGGFATGQVYIGGFPGGDESGTPPGASGPGSGSDGPDGESGDTYDMGRDEYSVGDRKD